MENSPEILELDELYWFMNKKGDSETRENVYIITMVRRNPRQIVGFSVTEEKTSVKKYKRLSTTVQKLENTAMAATTGT